MNQDAKGIDLRFCLRIPSILNHVDIVYEFLIHLAKEFNIQPERIDWVSMAFREAMNNAILHGNKKDPEKWVEVEMEKTGSKVILKVFDEGKGFDKEILRDPRTEENLFRPNGRGIFLIRQFVDDVRFIRNSEGLFGIELCVDTEVNANKEAEPCQR